MIDYYDIPYYAIKDIKEGADWILPSGEAVPSEKLTTPSYRPRKYAYCSDTAYSERLKDIIYGSNVLYHEATMIWKHWPMRGGTQRRGRRLPLHAKATSGSLS
jgi:ribonuclease Z